jgi:branched-chain amino acid transport system permease protein
MGDSILIVAFVVIVIGGIGSVTGAFVAAILVGVVDTMGRFLLPQWLGFTVGPALASMTNYLLMTAVLYWRPYGLFSSPGRN